MSLQNILKSRKEGYKPKYAIIVMSDHDQYEFDSLMQVQINSAHEIERMDFRPLVRMRLGVINIDQEIDRAINVLNKLADQQVTLYAFSGQGLPQIAEHVLCLGMEKIKPHKWSEEMLWRY